MWETVERTQKVSIKIDTGSVRSISAKTCASDVHPIVEPDQRHDCEEIISHALLRDLFSQPLPQDEITVRIHCCS